MMRQFVVVFTLLGLLAGCGAAEGPRASPSPTPEAARSLPIVDTARAALASHLGVDPQDIAVVKVEDAEWPNSGLGCPAPDQMYAEVITPGYMLTLEAGGTTYKIHTDRDGQALVLCQDGQPTRLGQSGGGAVPAEQVPTSEAGGASAAIVQLAIAALVQREGLQPDALEVVEVSSVEWPNAGVGCPAPNQDYAQVITPGYQVVLQSGPQSYEIHADEQGRIVVLCQDGLPTNLSTSAGGEARAPSATTAPVPTAQPTSDDRQAQPDDPGQSTATEVTMGGSEHLVQTAKEQLAAELGVAVADINVQTVEAVDWASSGLGCERPGEAYLTVITPGFRIILEHNGRSYAYHTDRGSHVIRCDDRPQG